METWEARLYEKKILIADGAWGTELSRRGLPSGNAPEKWNLDNPDAVESVASAYVAAGADIILTNTFGGSSFKLRKVGLGEKVAEVNRRGVELSKKAAEGKALVFASMGPTGEFMEPVGTVTSDQMTGCFARQVTAFIEAGANGIVIETMTDLNEAKAALRAVKEHSSLPVVISMTFDKVASGFATMMGIKPGQAAQEFEKAGADIVGANCGAGIQDMVEVIKLMHEATKLPLWAKPNAGLPELVDGKTVFRQTPEEMVKYLPALVEAGAIVVGGCCGTTPAHIKLLAQEAQNIMNAGYTYLKDLTELKGGR